MEPSTKIVTLILEILFVYRVRTVSSLRVVYLFELKVARTTLIYLQ